MSSHTAHIFPIMVAVIVRTLLMAEPTKISNPAYGWIWECDHGHFPTAEGLDKYRLDLQRCCIEQILMSLDTHRQEEQWLGYYEYTPLHDT